MNPPPGFRRDDGAGRAGEAIPPDQAADERAKRVWEALEHVSDPELDQSVVALGFVSEVTVIGDTAAVDFRLPTFWCSANFAWIMAEDMRLALAGLAWLRQADIRLIDHFAADKINRGIAEERSFQETFGKDAGGDLGALRATFRRKAFLGRMSALIEALRERGWSDDRITTARVVDLAAMRSELAVPVERFLEQRAFFGGSCAPTDVAFRTAEGDLIPATGLPAFLRDIRMTRRGVEANGEMCRILLAERYRSGGSEPAGKPMAS